MIEIQRYGCLSCAFTLQAPVGRHLFCPGCKRRTGDKIPMEPVAKFGPVPGTTSLDPGRATAPPGLLPDATVGR